MGMKQSVAKEDFLKLLPGDKLLVRKDPQYIEDTCGIPYGLVDDMEKLEGEVVTVAYVSNDPDNVKGSYVSIEEDSGGYFWAPEWLECKVKVITSSKDEPLGLSWKKTPNVKKESESLAKVIDMISEKWGTMSHKERMAVAEYIAGKRPSSLCEPPDDTAKIATYDFSYSPDGKVICRNLETGETATARCHEEDIFSVEVGQLVSFAHMLGYDVDHCGSNDRFSLIKKKPAYYCGEKVLVDCGHPDCPKAMKENYKDEFGIILSYSLDRKANTYIYKVVFKDEKIYKLQENVLKNVPINFIPGAMDLEETLATIKKK